MARKLLTPALKMRTDPANNLTGCLQEFAALARLARDDAQAERLALDLAADMVEFVRTERLAAAGRLAAWLAHRINNPLGAISGHAQLLSRLLNREVEESDSLQAYTRRLNAIQNQVERCAEITDDLLDFTRPTTARFAEVDVIEAVREAIELARYGGGQIDIRERVEGRSDLFRTRTDKDLFVRALYEVTLNSVQASPNNRNVEIMVGVDPERSRSPKWIRVTAADGGPGIPEAILPRVFDPLFSTREGARGLGLTMSLAIMRQLGGTVDIDKTGPEGTRVSIRLPTRRR